MMSGSVLAPWAHQVNPRDNARILARNLGCYDTYYPRSLLQCLQVFQLYRSFNYELMLIATVTVFKYNSDFLTHCRLIRFAISLP